MQAPDDGSRQLAAIGYGCLVLLGAAIYTVDVSTSSRYTLFLHRVKIYRYAASVCSGSGFNLASNPC
jgi:hypothetical protein